MFRAKIELLPFTVLACLLIFCTVINAQDTYKGWKKNSEYHKLYNNKEKDRLKGEVVKFITVAPLDNMAKGTALLLDEGDGDRITVDICPEQFASARDTGIKKGLLLKSGEHGLFR